MASLSLLSLGYCWQQCCTLVKEARISLRRWGSVEDSIFNSNILFWAELMSLPSAVVKIMQARKQSSSSGRECCQRGESGRHARITCEPVVCNLSSVNPKQS